MHLTNADRHRLLESFRTFANDWHGDDSDLVRWATGWAASHVPTFGFELGLGRDVCVLCDTLRRSAPKSESARLARGGLAYLHQGNQASPPHLGPIGLLDDVFVAGFAAHAVRQTTGEAISFSPPRLSPEEQRRAEDIFLELHTRSAEEDRGLPERANSALSKLGNLLESGFLRRLRRNVYFLSRVLGDRDRPPDHRQIARAALHYVVLEDDAIPDSLGMIGFLDDYFIADLAVNLIDPGQPPWMDLIDAVVGAWPFLNMVTFGDGQRGIPASEFLMVNAALACPAVRGPAPCPLTHLVLPRPGPLPLLLGFFAALGELMSARCRQGSTVPFAVGQKVLVDGKTIRVFAGCQSLDGRLMFGLGRVRKEQGVDLGRIDLWPMEHLYRLVPADAKKTTRGKLSISGRTAEQLGALDYLFLSTETVTIPPNTAQVVVITPVGLARRTAESVTLFGQKLCDIIPLGNLMTTSDICTWSSRFGSTRPSVLVIPDLDRACEYVEGAGDTVSLTIVDSSGHNAGRLASLSRLEGIGARLLVTVSQADADAIDTGPDSTVWEWDRSDFESLCVEFGPGTSTDNPIRAFEQGVMRAVTAEVKVVHVQCPEAEAAVRSVTAVKQLVEARGEDVPQELETALGRAFAVLTRLLRCPFRVLSHPRLHADLAASLDALSGCGVAGSFLTDQEKAAVGDAQKCLRNLFTLLQLGNPKEQALADLRCTCPGLAVVCGDVDLLEGADALKSRPLASALDQSESCQESGHAVAGWFGRPNMTRLLRPPFATPLYLILYGPEMAWHRAFTRRARGASASGRTSTPRARLFPSVGTWPDSAATDPAPGDNGATLAAGGEISDGIATYLLSKRRNRLTSLAKPLHGEESVEARLITFDGGYAFLTDDYQAKVATHLLGAVTDSEHAELEVVPACRLRRGDVLVFLRGSSRDVIRQVADQLLPPGERDRAALWRRALLKYRGLRGCSTGVVWRRLRDLGCPLSQGTVEHWFASDSIIAPQNFDRELRTILELTQDSDLGDGLEDCFEAIRRVRGAHLRASNQLARRVLERAVAGLKFAGHAGGTVDLGEDIILATVAEIDDSLVGVKASVANHLVEESPWPE